MKEIRSIIQRYDELRGENQKMAIATVIHVEDSSYRRSGARMLIMEDGSWVGGISGGCLEGDTLRKAQYVMYKGEFTTVRYDTREDDANQIGVGLGCNGLIDVLIAPIDHDDPKNHIELLRNSVNLRVPTILLTNKESGAVSLYDSKQVNQGTMKAVSEIFAMGKSQQVKINGITTFVEILPPSIALYIYGHNYDVIPLVTIARQVGWSTHIVSNPDKITKSLYNLVDSVIDSKKDSPNFDPYSAALLMSHDYKTDMRHLIALQSQSLPYIGMLGPKSRRVKVLHDIQNSKTEIDESNLYGPMGLDTGATTPEEIAISIIAEVRACFAGRVGGMLKDRLTKIND